MAGGQWLHPSPFILQGNFHFHMHHTLSISAYQHQSYQQLLSISTFHWLLNNHDGKQTRECKNSKMCIRKCKIWKYISLQNALQDILQSKIYSLLTLNKTAQQNSQYCTTKCTTKCTKKFIEKLNFLLFWFC